ncbi:MAG TPA: hypothetical protein VMT32_07270 [Bryobacteraceae bacterium]|nr:hypothetical protein [Bryobacteraceae bacterium]
MTLFTKCSFWIVCACLTLQAATISSTVVYTQPSGAVFYVDGQRFDQPTTFMWPQGSKHTLNIDMVQRAGYTKVQYAFVGWTDSTGTLTGSSPMLVVTADPAIAFYAATVNVQYAVSLDYFACSAPDPTDCDSPGTVYVNNIPYVRNTDVYADAGATVVLRAVPNPGYVFTGWLPGYGNGTQTYVNSFTLNQPVTVYPQFVRAGAVTLATNPPGLAVLADTTQVLSPITLDWGMGTTHTVAAVTPQTDPLGKLWVFDSWSDAGDATHKYTMPAKASVTLTATYKAGGYATFTTNPPGLKLVIDGRDNWPGYNFVWSSGKAHTISAPQQQVDANGHGWSFKSWSNGGPATQTLVLSNADVAAGVRLIATFTPSSQTTGQTTIQSSPSGVDVLVDGSDCLTPCTLQRTIGSLIHVSAPTSVALSSDTRLQFAGWADGIAGDRTIAVTANPQTFSANYKSNYLLACTANPASAVTWQLAPASADSFYPAGTAVTVSISVASGYRFDGWGGDASGTATTITQTMDRPHSIWPKLTRVASNGVDGILNAAGETPEAAVAPGSLISIYGPRLASSLEAGPTSPLAQTLAGVTVTVGDWVLPLLFVSPGQINAQLSSSLPEGEQTLTVHAVGQPDATGTFTVQRNAPGLFSQQTGGKPYLIALHEDGSLVTPQSPARHGEVVTALGTGFGPSKPQPPDGFATPSSPAFPLVDAAELVFQDHVIQPEFAGAAPGHVGMTAVKFRIADPLPAASTVEIKARVNGHASNTVLLPVE